MAPTHPNRPCARGSTPALSVTIPAAIVTGSQFPSDVDDAVSRTVTDDQLVGTPPTDEADE
jgi:hypothetical protein